MGPEIPLRCSCGTVQGSVRLEPAPKTLRVVCMCRDCQTYARFLGRADELLDDAGGTDLLQVAPAQLRIDEGTEHLACLRLSPKGALRWHTTCCRTPMANTPPGSGLPLVTVPVAVLHLEDGEGLEDRIGRVRARIHGRHAVGRAPAGSHPKMPPGFLVTAAGKMAWARVRGLHQPHPFFEHGTGRPRVEPRVLTLEERNRFRDARAISDPAHSNAS